MKKTTILFSLVTFFCLFLMPVNAETLGGKWTTNPNYYCFDSNFSTQNTSAVNDWYNALVGIGSSRRISKGSVTNSSVSILSSNYGDTGWNAMGEPGPSINSGTYTYATMRLNTTYMNGYSSGKKKAIITHEWGHILGLAHTTSKSNSSLMAAEGSSYYYDQKGISAPTSYDKVQLDKIY